VLLLKQARAHGEEVALLRKVHRRLPLAQEDEARQRFGKKFYFILFYFILFYFILFYFILFYFIL
jgi:hypothetical protein